MSFSKSFTFETDYITQLLSYMKNGIYNMRSSVWPMVALIVIDYEITLIRCSGKEFPAA